MRHTIWALVFAGCVSAPAHETANCGEEVLGTPSQLTTPIGSPSGVSIDSPAQCNDDSLAAYIRVNGHGTRTIAFGSAAQACTTSSSCISNDDLGRGVIARLDALGIPTIGFGLGVCGAVSDDYATWNMSISIQDWTDVDAAVAAVDDELRAQNVGQFFGISVRAITCAVPL